MTEDMNLLIAIAQTAGVFVGFGALISITSGSGMKVSQLGQIRAVVTIGLVAIVAALIPVALARYGLTGHSLWSLCSLLFLVLIWVVTMYSLKNPENRDLTIARARTNPFTTGFFWFLLEIPMQVPLIMAMLGIFENLEPAFYITALVLHIFQAAFVLAQFVYSHPNQQVQ